MGPFTEAEADELLRELEKDESIEVSSDEVEELEQERMEVETATGGAGGIEPEPGMGSESPPPAIRSSSSNPPTLAEVRPGDPVTESGGSGSGGDAVPAYPIRIRSRRTQ